MWTLQGGMDRNQLAVAHTQEVHNPDGTVDPILQHPLQLRSAYLEVVGTEPEFTSFHSKFCGTVDYIWYSPQVRLFWQVFSRSAQCSLMWHQGRVCGLYAKFVQCVAR